MLLIEPEWNVNNSQGVVNIPTYLAFNRTRMECKFLYLYAPRSYYRSFNRTRMECK